MHGEIHRHGRELPRTFRRPSVLHIYKPRAARIAHTLMPSGSKRYTSECSYELMNANRCEAINKYLEGLTDR